ncbi:hypothetical protein B0J11DRAFT_446471 [Dendryphion nanum]|uniref:Zn(2)-C6 fungal-type domain-containing protein n=1 Tax=Dendryphion nanum TaxID=256645 RepID=A0A9P9IAS5_9PLEO|nr:hypothetical protein B0J11DRAFT_446471 [Dendryphion nanum]
MNISSKQPHVRKKAFRPKTKTGCITCRIRRVKCDEGKPHCQRCTSTGRSCDGYAIAAPHIQTQETICTRQNLLFATASASTGLNLNSLDEREAFHFYQHHGAFELSGFFDGAFWQVEVLQASHSLPAVRYAIIALAAMHRKLVAGQAPVVPDDTSDKHLRFAIKQSNRAIREVLRFQEQSTVEEKVNMLLCCVLFHSLACIQGHQATALQHLRSGLKILREIDDMLGDTDDDAVTGPVSLRNLRAMIVTLDVQARGMLNETMLLTWEPQPKRGFDKSQVVFRSSSEVRCYFEAMLLDLLVINDAIDIHGPPSREKQVEMIAEVEEICIAFGLATLSYKAFLAKMVADPTADRQGLISIQLVYKQTEIFLNAPRDEDLSVLLDLAREFVKAQPDHTLAEDVMPESYYSVPVDGRKRPLCRRALARPVFSSSSGWLTGLWLVASQVRNRALRRQAIALLLDYPRREGAWDGILAGRIALEAMKIEEMAAEREEAVPLHEGSSLSSNRTRDISIEYERMRGARVEFRSYQEHQRGECGHVRYLAW